MKVERCGMKKILLIIIDGMADRPVPELGGQTPLEVARTPNLDKLAARGMCGLQNAIPGGVYPTSEEAHLAIFGYDWQKDLPGRGVLEALGLGINVGKKDLVLRVDFGTVDEGMKVIDPRAGNIKSVKHFCEAIGDQKIGTLLFKLYPGLAHRAVLSISGDAVSHEISHHSTIVSDTDPHKAKVHRAGNKVLKPEPLDASEEAKITAKALWEYQILTHEILDEYVENKVRKRTGHLPANFLLTRGAGFIKRVEPFHEKYHLNAACVAGAPLYKGIAKYLGMDVIDVKGATGGVDTDVFAKVEASLEKLNDGYDFVFMHLKGADVVAEERGDFHAKMGFFEKADKALGPLLKYKGIVCLTGDHATPCILSDHSDDPSPIMIVDGAAKRSDLGASLRSDFKEGFSDSVKEFNEAACKKGILGHMKGSQIMPKLIKEAKS